MFQPPLKLDYARRVSVRPDQNRRIWLAVIVVMGITIVPVLIAFLVFVYALLLKVFR